MKKVLIPAMMAVLVSCVHMEQEATLQNPAVPEGYKVLTITATKTDVDTKTAYAGDKYFSWNVGDEISVLCNDGSSNFWQTFTATTASASSTFTATVGGTVNLGPVNGSDYKVAMYPANDNHYYGGNSSLKYHIPAERDFRAANGGHAESAIPMFAWGTASDTYAFSNLSGAAKFTFKGITCSTVKMTFTTGNVKLNGSYGLLYSSVDTSNSSNVAWNADNAGSASEKTVTYYADVVNGRASFYLPYATGSIWGNSTLKLYDASTDVELYSNDHVGTIEITKNRIAVLPTLDVSTASSAFGINWAGVTGTTNTHNTYKALKSMKATLDENYLYLLLDVDPTKMCLTHPYDCFFHIYRGNDSGSKNSYWGSNKYDEIDSGHDKWASKDGDIYFSASGTTAYSSSLRKESGTSWIYEIRVDRSLDSKLTEAGEMIIGVQLDATYYGSPYGNSNSWYPYGVIPTYGTDLYTVSAKPAPTPDPLPESPVSIGFTEAAGEVPNPERGMMSYSELKFVGDAMPESPVGNVPVNYTGESLAFLQFYLYDYMNKDLDNAALTYIRAKFDKVRAANMKAIVRFSYTWDDSAKNVQHEATPTQLLKHADQVAPILSENADIIYLVQAGWLGVFGEWYYKTKNNGETVSDYNDYYLYTVAGSTVTDLNNNHKALVDKMLTTVPSPIHIGMRTSFYKRYYLSPSNITDWTEINAWSATPGANERLGFFNDGTRGSDSDVGTFNSQTDRDMWYSQGKYVICGGEMSYRSDAQFAALSDDLKDCDKSITEMRKQHFSYLHYSTSNKFMAKWNGEGRMEDLKMMLGYRLVLGDVEFTYPALTSGSTVNYSIKVKNTGCAPVYYARPFKLLLLHTSGAPDVLVDNLGDIRTIEAGADFTTLSGSFSLPVDVASGDKLAIWLPDRTAGLQSNAAYSIRFANSDVTWDNGYNVLYTF